jgi:hypothetical protein
MNMIKLLLLFIKFCMNPYKIINDNSHVIFQNSCFYFWQLPTCRDSSTQYFTVTVEKAVTHIIVKSISSTPQRGRLNVSSSAAMYLKKLVNIIRFHKQKNNSTFNSVICYNRTAVSAGDDICSC